MPRIKIYLNTDNWIIGLKAHSIRTFAGQLRRIYFESNIELNVTPLNIPDEWEFFSNLFILHEGQFRRSKNARAYGERLIILS